MSEQVTTERLEYLIVEAEQCELDETDASELVQALRELKAMRLALDRLSAQDFAKFRRNMIRLTAEIGE